MIHKDFSIGRAELSHASTSEITVFGVKKRFSKPISFPILHVNGQLAMSASPQEVQSMKDDAKDARGDALVGGLGLGVVLEYLRPRCTSITVVERERDVVKVYRKFRSPKKPLYDRVVVEPIEDFLTKTKMTFDFIHLDTWFTGDYEFLPHLNWLREQAQKRLRPKGIVRLWNYETMVRSFVRECVALAAKKGMILGASPEKIDGLKGWLPMIGEFSSWFRANPDSSLKDINEKADSVARATVKRDISALEFSEDVRCLKNLGKEIPAPSSPKEALKAVMLQAYGKYAL